MYWAQQFVTTNLPEIKKGAYKPALAKQVDAYYKQSLVRSEALKNIFNVLVREPEPKECESIYGLVDEITDWFSHMPNKSVSRDLLMINSMQKITQYFMASYRLLILTRANELKLELFVLAHYIEEEKNYSEQFNVLGKQLAGRQWL